MLDKMLDHVNENNENKQYKQCSGFSLASVQEMRMLDLLMVEEFHVSVATLMENAGHAVADVAGKMLGSVQGKKIVVLCGKGNNGGDGLVAARYLVNAGAHVVVILASKIHELKEEPRRQFEQLKKTRGILEIITVNSLSNLSESIKRGDLLIDALLGFNVKGSPEGAYARLIEQANHSNISILSVDVPSGLNADTGKPFHPTIKASATVTFALPKKGFFTEGAKQYLGRLFVADIGILPEAYAQLNMSVPEKFRNRKTIEVY